MHWTRARYFSKVGSLVMYSFSIYPDMTLESVRSTKVCPPMAHNFWRPNKMASYSMMLLVHLSVPLVK
jgi:hypothetical protein